jgi:peptide/nickel transport system substrate-binding protein
MNLAGRLNRPLSALVVLILAGGCGPGDRPAVLEDEPGPPEPGGTAIVVEGADMTIPLAMVAQGTLDGNLGGDVMYMELVRGDWDGGRLVFRTADENPMAIARTYEHLGADSSSLRFHMRSDVRWSDGTPLTAHDVAFSYGILGDPDLASPLQHYVQFLESIEVENDSTVVFHFTRRYPDMLTHTALALLPRHVFGETPVGELRDHPRIRNPEGGNLVVSGPYMIGSWERGQRIVLVRNPHFRPAGHLDQIVFRIIPEPTTRLIELQTGTVDMVTGIALDQVPHIRSQARHVRIEREEKRFYDYVGYNGARFAPFADPGVRRALGLAIDAQGIIDALQMEEFAVPAGGPYAPIFRDLFDPQGQAPLPYDPDEARRILAAQGWRDTDNDGILDRDGLPFRFTLTTNAGNQRRADVSQILQQQWRRIGVDVRIQVLEFNTMSASLRDGSFEAVLGGWSVGLSPDLTALWGPESPFNYTGYRHPEVTRLIEEARAQPTYEAAAPLWRRAASRIVADQPYTWLYYMDGVGGVHNRVRGAKIDTYGPYQNVWEWWIPRSQRRAGEAGR